MEDEAPVASEPDNEDWLAAEIATGLTFASSDAVMLTEAKGLHPMARSIAILVIVVSLMGFINGLDFASPEQGVVRPDEFVYAMARAAPEDTAVFRGTVEDHRGVGLEGVTVFVQWETGNQWVFAETQTDAQGEYLLENLTPGLVRVDLVLERDNHTDVLSNRALLSPPALFEPYGFTTITFDFPSQAEFSAAPCNNGASTCELRTIDKTPGQMEHPLMDPAAAGLYVVIGYGFMGLALISGGFAVTSLRLGSLPLLRVGSVLCVFTMGHFYSACILGLTAVILTFLVPRRLVPVMS